MVARAIAAHMEKTLGVSIPVRNTPGAGGTLGPGRIAQSKPDGYTFGLTGLSVLVVAPLTMDLPFKPMEAFDFLGCTSELRIGVPVGPRCPRSAPWRSSSPRAAAAPSPWRPPTPARPSASSSWRG
ncbi:tripartite tricarboxylate transporter substrate-binding protein [Paeniroseomonas aquatica]|uniref:tripartite tricarboxylate transporter substrate-binding protein n=1 Tax=Paeniroseomonas aquatica TaxID=373043 RepID=UPI00361F0281